MNHDCRERHSINGRIEAQMVGLEVVRNSARHRQQKDVRVGVVEEQPGSLRLADAAIRLNSPLCRLDACMCSHSDIPWLNSC